MGGCAPYLAGLMALFIGILGWSKELAKLWSRPESLAAVDIALPPVAEDPGLLLCKGFEPGENGYYLGPEKVGVVVYRLETAPKQALVVEPVFYNVAGQKKFRNRVSFSQDEGKSYTTLGENRSYLRGQGEIVPEGESRSVLLRFDAANTTDEKALVLQGFRLRRGIEPDVVPRLSGILYGVALAFLVILVVRFGDGTGCVGFIFGVLASFLPVFWPAGFPAVGLLLLAILLGNMASEDKEFHELWELSAILLILAWGLDQREVKLMEYAHAPLSGDAGGYREIAQDLRLFSWKHGFYAPRWREPVFPLAAKAFFTIFRDSELHLRLVSMYAGVVAIALAWWVGRKVLHPICGLFAALVMAADKYLILRAMYGYRLEVQTCFLLLFLTAFLVSLRVRSVLRGIIAGSAGALLVLTELSALPVVVLFLAGYLWVLRREWKRALLGPAAFVVLLLPFFLRQAAEFGDPLHPLSIHARWYRNVEFQKNAGLPGYPPREDIAEYTGYGGPEVSLPGYLLGQHTAGELWHGVSRGYLRYFSGDPFFREAVMRVLFFIGLVLLPGVPGGTVVLLALILANAPPVMYLYGSGILTEERVLLHVYPLAAYCAVSPILWLFARTTPIPPSNRKEEEEDEEEEEED